MHISFCVCDPRTRNSLLFSDDYHPIWQVVKYKPQLVLFVKAMIDIHKLRVFCAVVDTGSFSLTASRLRLSQPVVSAHVLELESLVGLNRSKRPVGPTEEGTLLYNAAQKLFTDIIEVETTIAEINDGKRGDVTVSAGSLVGSVILPPLLFRFRKAVPSINIHVRRGTSQQTLDRISSGSSDFGLLFSVAPQNVY
jgi:DNA-binding transcriptional LysR family regulator